MGSTVGEFEHLLDATCGTLIPKIQILAFFSIAKPAI
jgi:hypothetical protein